MFSFICGESKSLSPEEWSPRAETGVWAVSLFSTLVLQPVFSYIAFVVFSFLGSYVCWMWPRWKNSWWALLTPQAVVISVGCRLGFIDISSSERVPHVCFFLSELLESCWSQPLLLLTSVLRLFLSSRCHSSRLTLRTSSIFRQLKQGREGGPFAYV